MTDSQSSISFKKEDGKPITFNFQLENDLPYKTILSPNFKFVHSKKTDEFGIYITFSNNELIELNSLNIIDFKLFNNDFWIILNNHYIVLYNLNNTIMNELNKNNLVFCFFDENEKFLNGFKLE